MFGKSLRTKQTPTLMVTTGRERLFASDTLRRWSFCGSRLHLRAPCTLADSGLLYLITFTRESLEDDGY